MNDGAHAAMLESELAECKRKLAETTQHLASANQIIGAYSTVVVMSADTLRGLIARTQEAPAAAHDHTDPTARCQSRAHASQCSLPDGHQCDCAFLAPPLTMIQALAWAEERRMAITSERSASLGELKRRADWLADECRRGGSCYVERDEAYVAVKTLERFYEHGTPGGPV